MRISHVFQALSAHACLMLLVGRAVAAPCITPPLASGAVDQFKANPAAIAGPNSDTRTIEVVTRDLAGTDPNLAVDLIGVAKGTSPRFRTAIAAGLAQAAVICSNIDQKASLSIQQAVASFEDGQFQEAFAAVSGDLSTAATEAAFASATGSVGSVAVVNPNVSARTLTNPGAGGSIPLVQITSNPVTINSTISPSTTTTAASPVSPTR